MEVLVLGGTGTMGAPLVDILSQNGHTVYVLSQHNHQNKSNVYYIVGNGMDNEFLKFHVLCRHYSAIVDFLWYDESKLRSRINYFLDSTDQYICLGSAAVYSNYDGVIEENGSRWIDVLSENQVVNNHQYHIEKARVENVVLKSTKKNWTLLRPHVTFNRNHLPMYNWLESCWLFRVLTGHSISIPQNILSLKTNYTYGGDVAMMIYKLIGNSKALGQVYNVVSDDVFTFEELITIYRNVLSSFGLQLKIIYEEDTSNYEKSFPLVKDRLDFDRKLNRTFSNIKLKNDVPELYFTPIEIALTQCIQGYIDNFSKGKLLIDAAGILYEDFSTRDSVKWSDFNNNSNRILYYKEKYAALKLIIRIISYINRKTKRFFK